MINLILPDGSSWSLENIDTREVYDHIADYLTSGNTNDLTPEQHTIAADAEGWCELACIGDYYEDNRLPGMSISIEE